jgi:WD40 repeat protein
VENDQEVWRYQDPRGDRAFGSLVYGADGKHVAVATRKLHTVRRTQPRIEHDEILILAAGTGEVLRTLKTPEAFNIDHLVLNRAGTRVAGRIRSMPGEGFDRTIEFYVVVWNVETGEETVSSKIEDPAPRLCGFSHDGQELLISQWGNGGLLVLNAATGAQQRIIAPKTRMNTCSLSPDGKTVAVLSAQRPGRDVVIALYDVTTGKAKSSLRGHYRPRTVHWSSDGRRLAVLAVTSPRFATDRNVVISVWDTATGRPVLHLNQSDPGSNNVTPHALRFSPNNHRLLRICGDNRVEQESSDATPVHPLEIWDATPLAENQTENLNSP